MGYNTSCNIQLKAALHILRCIITWKPEWFTFQFYKFHCYCPRFLWSILALNLIQVVRTPREWGMHTPYLFMYPFFSRTLILPERASYNSQAKKPNNEWKFLHTFTWTAKHAKQESVWAQSSTKLLGLVPQVHSSSKLGAQFYECPLSRKFH